MRPNTYTAIINSIWHKFAVLTAVILFSGYMAGNGFDEHTLSEAQKGWTVNVSANAHILEQEMQYLRAYGSLTPSQFFNDVDRLDPVNVSRLFGFHGLVGDTRFSLSDEPHTRRSRALRLSRSPVTLAGLRSDIDTSLPALPMTSEPASHIRDVTITADNLVDFVVTLEVPDLEALTTDEMVESGFEAGTVHSQRVEFLLKKLNAESIRYALSARRSIVRDTETGRDRLSDPTYSLHVRSARGSLTFVTDIDGTWDEQAGTISWFVPKAELNVARTPVSFVSIVDRNGRVARDGDQILQLNASLTTSFWSTFIDRTPVMTVHDRWSEDGSYVLGSYTSSVRL